MKAAIETTAAISQGFALGRQGVLSEGGARPVPDGVSPGSAIESNCSRAQTSAETRSSQQHCG
jgi:hypothetical protein